MLAYLIRRLFAAAVMLVVIILVVFCIFFLVPKWAGVDIALNFVGKQADPAAVEGVREKLGLGDPVLVQAWEFFKGIFAGRTYAAGGDVTHCAAPCFGYSFKTEQSVWPVLTERFPVTLALALGAAVLWLIFGVAAGVLSALKRGTLWDRGAMVVALAGVSLPIYFTGLLSLAIFSYGLGWIDGEFVPLEDSFSGWFGGMILPWITLAFLYAAMYARITRATMLEILGEDYIRTARAKGLKEQVVISKHAMRSTLTPLLTMLGMDLGALMGGAILTETTFSLPGLGQKVLDAIQNHDLPFILGVVLITSLAVLIANLVVDVLYAVIDPRVRLA
ncbi:ABC transporter permease [Streptomyces sp. G3]|uniref:ABC transporter permease n=1 Tax=Streptomyces salinarius TaxID=2762598 RepID=A0ABW8BJY2_9ACTN|nr:MULTISPECIES: ABC transporter permease [Streptomyces]NDZ74430.1 ABC transporter permease [Streptomyces sp. SID10362]WSU01105.1 ABC transporter permease [Streptomyces sp. NBC_01124]AZM75385.1 ABC transporter permease [Streptomyces sp. KPB2]MBH5130177.1 ABC transporter permease [Streptomyces sp. HB-N217]MCM1942052.1 ABC transporter permease [Streptomyces sp. G3]